MPDVHFNKLKCLRILQMTAQNLFATLLMTVEWFGQYDYDINCH